MGTRSAGLAAFTADGVLPAGSFALPLDEIRQSMLVNGPGPDYPHLPGLIAGHDDHGNPLEFPAFFRTSRRPLPSGATQKGIIKIRRQP